MVKYSHKNALGSVTHIFEYEWKCMNKQIKNVVFAMNEREK